MVMPAVQPRPKRERTRGELSLVPVYIPTASLRADILPGSAIVGVWDFTVGRVQLDFEGNKYGAVNLSRYVERVHNAWDRHVTKYPTMARLWAFSHEVSIVAEYDPLKKRVVVSPYDMPRLAQWLGIEGDVPEQELVL